MNSQEESEELRLALVGLLHRMVTLGDGEIEPCERARARVRALECVSVTERLACACLPRLPSTSNGARRYTPDAVAILDKMIRDPFPDIKKKSRWAMLTRAHE